MKKNAFRIIEKSLKRTGFEIIKSEEYFPWMRFYDLKALVYYAKIIIWPLPNFSVENHYKKFKGLNRDIIKMATSKEMNIDF